MLIKLRKGKFWTNRLREKFLRHSGSHVSCLMKQAVNAPIWGRFVNAMGSVASCYALSKIGQAAWLKTHCRRWQNLVGTWPTTAFFRLLYKSLYMNFHCQSVCSSSNCMIKTDYTLYFIETVGNLFQFCLQ